MPGRAGAACLSIVAVLAGVTGCDDDEPGRSPGAATPRPPEGDYCSYPQARDAGDAKPSRGDARTLVLRRSDLPEGGEFAAPQGVGTFTYEDAPIAAVLRRNGWREVARSEFRLGYRAPDRRPGEPYRPEPRSCSPATRIDAAALTFDHARGAEVAFRARSSIAGSTVGSGIGPIGERERMTDSPVALGDEAALIEAPTDRMGTINRTIIWRDGPLIGIVKVEGRDGERDLALLERLAKRQAEYLAAAR
ncbi:MAG: hypothetical protein M3340_17000 [Actinomycetota bacterium]|nr:hypothetical protein [Actinomycetota bacterium]